MGKTTLALALADALAADEQAVNGGETESPSVVAVDLDPQASLTAALLYHRREQQHEAFLNSLAEEGRTISAAVAYRLKQRAVPAPLLTFGRGPSAAPYVLAGNDASAWDVERRALRKPGGLALVNATQDVLDDLAKQFRYVVIDCPPGQTLMAEAAILKANLLLCPTTPDKLALWGLETFQTYLRELFDEHERAPPKAFWVVTRYNARAARSGPQAAVLKKLESFSPETAVVTLLREAGEHGLGGPIVVPHDPAIARRLEGPQRPSRVWPWDATFKEQTRQALARLMRAVKREVEDG